MLSRRRLVAALAAGIAAMAARPLRAQRAAKAPYNDRGDRRRFAAAAAAMRDRAIADGDQPYGAVVVKAGRIVGLGPSRVVVDSDPTAHAEMTALRDAARTLGTHELSGCELYTTAPPCRMCETAAHWASIGRVYTGPDAADRGRPGYGC